MNLIKDAWMPVMRAESGKAVVAPWQIAEQKDPVMDLAAPRPDFQGAMYQFLIGLLQTGFSPEDQDEWMEYWNKPPDAELFKSRLEVLAGAFELDKPDGPLFMQDYEDFEGEELPIEDLIGGAISDSTRNKNQDLFVKRDHVRVVSPYWAAVGLFNMQITGVLAWGKHRVGLRGNGPVTTLLMPDQNGCSLWKKLWMNVLSDEDFVSIPGEASRKDSKYIFPWLAKTRKSPNKEITSPQDCNPLQHYWPMPRRIRLLLQPVNAKCDMSGDDITVGVFRYKRIKDGVYYNNGWKHPLTPYSRKSMESFPKAVTGSKISFDFRDWASLTLDGTLGDEDCSRAEIVTIFQSQLARYIKCKTILWSFAYNALNANVRCWYDNRLPILGCNKEYHKNIKSWANEFIYIANEHVLALKIALVRAWFNPQVDSNGNETWKHVVNKNGDTSQAHLSTIRFVEQDYWRNTEGMFYKVLNDLFDNAASRDRPLKVYKEWIEYNWSHAINTFDNEAFAYLGDDRDVKRAVLAKYFLIQELKPKKGFLADMYQSIQTI